MKTNPMETNGGLREGSYAVDRNATEHVTDELEWPDDERVPLVVVLEFRPLPANAVLIDALGKTVYEVNTDYSPQADVASVVFVDTLDSYAGDSWETWPRDEFGQRLNTYMAKWGIPVTTYDYPAPRLRDVGRVDEWSPDEARERAITHLCWLAGEERDGDE